VSCEFLRAEQYRNEVRFLLAAHAFRRIILIFHGRADDGPEHSTCAHYLRLMPGRTRDEIILRQQSDIDDVSHYLRGLAPDLDLDFYRAEVAADFTIHYIPLRPSGGTF
jgi:hypothetical protein